MALSFDIQSQSIFAEINAEQITGRYECALNVCPSPSCGCKVIHLDVVQSDAADNVAQPASRIVKFDLSDRSLTVMHKDKSSLEELSFAKKFLSCLNDDDFEFLSREQWKMKNRLTEEAQPETIDAYFDFTRVERIGVLSGYSDVLPYADRMNATLDGKKYRILDHYCLRSNCHCSDTNLSVMDFDETEGKEKEVSCINVDYKKKVWKMVDEGSLSLDTDILRSALEHEIPALYDTLYKRHARLKSIYTFNKKKHSGSGLAPVSPKIGRNDLCPCGSGKKFKKCCAVT